MRIAFCDDDEKECELLISYAAHYAVRHSLHIEPHVYRDAGSLLEDPDVGRMSALFLDIYMNGVSGLEAARILREREYDGAIVLCTASRDHFADGFDVDASHYLIKPVEYQGFAEAMRRVLRLAGNAARTITVHAGRDRILVPVAQILFAEVFNHATVLHLQSGTLTIGQSLSTLEEMLGGEPFLRCYRSYIVNMAYVEKLEDNAFLMKNGARVPIARDGRKDVQSRYLSYVFNRMEEL